ncbi:DNA-binding transcriptional ArsR family regulator [Leifsonia sp. AK011]|uniref:ArsR/SmtB family transcription factor n=1 Tax=Leifsonia sp. AK011 TaxID=2723075 RepID=UPI0017C4332B|nr:metalloregulator ArsR/SmtB family transcription factor [Leifsonia sp. AK011]NYF10881.1 DNA-binding transcriptional ArsR family regulator [Leifsonia sp. AK011]
MDAVFKAIADPVRRAIVDDLTVRNDQTLFEICVRLITERGMSMSRQAVSKHISILREAGLVTVASVGRTTVHHLETDALAEVRRWIETVQGETP